MFPQLFIFKLSIRNYGHFEQQSEVMAVSLLCPQMGVGKRKSSFAPSVFNMEVTADISD